MQQPNYVLKATEAVLVDKNDSVAFVYYKRVVLIVVGVIIIASVLLGENIFYEMSSHARFLVIMSIVYAIFGGGGTVRKPSEFELHFYDDYFLLVREKISYNKTLTRKKIEKMFYRDVKKFEYSPKYQRINFYGIVEGVAWKYKKNGELQDEPYYHKTTDSLCYFYTALSDIDFVKEIEDHSPLKMEYF